VETWLTWLQSVLGEAANVLTSFVLLACAVVIELVVLSIVRARMGHPGKKSPEKPKISTKIVDFSLPLRPESWYTVKRVNFLSY